MSQPQRETALRRFERDDEVTVFLVSLRSGGVGLNLTAADRCYLLDIWWNPAVEEQAIDRVHRVGQPNAVYVKRCARVCPDSKQFATLMPRMF